MLKQLVLFYRTFSYWISIIGPIMGGKICSKNMFKNKVQTLTDRGGRVVPMFVPNFSHMGVIHYPSKSKSYKVLQNCY